MFSRFKTPARLILLQEQLVESGIKQIRHGRLLPQLMAATPQYLDITEYICHSSWDSPFSEQIMSLPY